MPFEKTGMFCNKGEGQLVKQGDDSKGDECLYKL